MGGVGRTSRLPGSTAGNALLDMEHCAEVRQSDVEELTPIAKRANQSLMSTIDLFSPTAARTARRSGTQKPWYVTSQLWPAFFGGIFALFGIAWLNSYRLSMTGTERLAMIVLTMLTFGAVTGGIWVYATLEPDVELSRTTIRLLYRAGALVLYLALARLQLPASRRWQMLASSDEDDHASLWIPGFVAVFVGGFVQAGVMGALLLPLLRPELLEAP